MPFLRSLALWAAILVMLGMSPTLAQEAGQYRLADGVAVYLGLLPAAIVRGHRRGHPEAIMHSGAPAGRHVYHLVVALFDAESGERIEDATVEAQVAPLALSGTTRRLEPMTIADTVTYGEYFTTRGEGRYRIALTITRPGSDKPIETEFDYEHRTR
jgi:hypothetical protein